MVRMTVTYHIKTIIGVSSFGNFHNIESAVDARDRFNAEASASGIGTAEVVKLTVVTTEEVVG